jgi:hypothetical protein
VKNALSGVSAGKAFASRRGGNGVVDRGTGRWTPTLSKNAFDPVYRSSKPMTQMALLP